MALNTFTPAVRPSPGTSFANEVNLFEPKFGYGYTGSAPVGLNHIAKNISLKWTALTLTQALALDAFFRGQGGYIPFYYTLNGEITARKFTCKKWEFSDGTPASFSATFMENFSNVS